MDHLVFLEKRYNELELLVRGEKSMIIRGSAGKPLPHGIVSEGDILYFSNDDGGAEILARGVVSSVMNSDELTQEESFETIIRNQDRLQLPDEQFYKLAGKRFLVIIGISEICRIDPIQIQKLSHNLCDDWIAVGNLALVRE